MREVLFSMVVRSTKEVVLAKYPDLDLNFLVIEEEEVEETTSEAAELGPEGKRTAGDEAGTLKVTGAVQESGAKVAEKESEAVRASDAEMKEASEIEVTEKDGEGTGDVNPRLECLVTQNNLYFLHKQYFTFPSLFTYLIFDGWP